MKIVDDAQRRLRAYVPITMTADLGALDAPHRAILRHLVEAAERVDEIFWRQTSHDALEWRARVDQIQNPDLDVVKRLFAYNYGPYDRLGGNRPFLGDKKKPRGAGFYPEDLDRTELRELLEARPILRAAVESPYTLVRRDDRGSLATQPYREAYADLIGPVVQELRAAAAIAGDTSLGRYTHAKADALLADEFAASDALWLALDDPIDYTMGPYETYEDHLLGCKTSYEAIINLVDTAATAALVPLEHLIDDIEEALPYPAEYKHPRPSTRRAAFKVVTSILRRGSAVPGYQFVAVTLPNDPVLQAAHGTLTIIHHNFLDARVTHIIKPLSERLISPELLGHLSTDACFDLVIGHELSRDLGLKFVRGTEAPLGQALKETFLPLDAAKADVQGMLTLDYMVREGLLPEDRRLAHDVTFLASCFRTIRFGHQAQSRGAMIVLNYLLEEDVLEYDPVEGTFSLRFDEVTACLARLGEELVTIMYDGAYARARRFLARYGVITPVISGILGKVEDAPVDFFPTYVLDP